MASEADAEAVLRQVAHHKFVGQGEGCEQCGLTERLHLHATNCPTPVYHEMFNYCPSCPWVRERNDSDSRNDA